MKIYPFVKYILRDIFCAQRTKFEIIMGSIAVAIASSAWLITYTFSESFHKYVDDCFFQARPVIGTLQLKPKSHRLISKEEEASLENFIESNDDIEGATWITLLNSMQIHKSETQEFGRGLEPAIWSVPYGSPILESKFGIPYVKGKPFENIEPDKLRFSILVNTSFLEKYYGYKENIIKDIMLGKEYDKLPEHLFIHFTPIPCKPQNFEPGTIKVPISGVFHLPDNIFPHLIFNFDTAGAYFYQNRQRWEASYIIQFYDATGKNLLLDQSQIAESGKVINTDKIVTLPSKKNLFNFSLLLGNDKTPFRSVLLHTKNYKQQGLRSKIKESLQKSKFIFAEVVNKGIFDDLDNGKTKKIRELLIEKGITLSPTSRIGIRSKGTSWILSDEGNRKSYELSKEEKNKLRVCYESYWLIEIPSSTASQALNRVKGVVDFYTRFIGIIIMAICAFSTLLFGIGHVYRKKKDIGLHKSCGMGTWLVGEIFITQVLIVSLLGFLIGLGLTVIIAVLLLEEQAMFIVENLNSGFLVNQKMMDITIAGIVKTLALIVGSSLVGSIPPSIMAMFVKPIDNLKSGL